MKTSNSPYLKFLDERYIPLPPKVKFGIMVAVLLLPLVIFYFAFYMPKTKTINNLDHNRTALVKDIKEVEIEAADEAKFEEERKKAEDIFNQKALLLPEEKEIPKLLKDISALGRSAGLDFLTFKPLADVPKDFYAEIPVSINVRGPYHNMGYFFDQVSKLERIVSVSNVKMTSPKKEGGEMLLKSDCKLVTYRFTNVELTKNNTK